MDPFDKLASALAEALEADRTTPQNLRREHTALTLQQSEILYRTLAEALPAILWVALPDGAPIYYNQPWEEYSGCGLQETQQYGWNSFLAPEDVPGAEEAGRNAEQKGERYEVEYRLRGKDGVYRWFLSRGLPIKDAAGQVICWFGACIDIDSQKRAEAELEHRQTEIVELNQRLQRAMTETHHRVKNNLQVIAAMVDIQLMDGGDTIPSTEFQRLGRQIGTLAIIHDMLTEDARGDAASQLVSSRDLLARLAAQLQQAGGRAVHCDLMNAALSTRQGTSLALVANELISNAIKHGRSLIHLAFAVQANQAELNVRDDGPGFPPDFDAVLAANTGLELVESLTRSDLRGTVRYENPPAGGASVVITFALNP